MRTRLLIPFCLAAVIACSSLPYKDDVGFLVSAQANAPEFPITINGKTCADIDGIPGMCSKRVKSNEDVKIHLDTQLYGYDLTVACTAPIAVNSASVPAGQSYDLVIPALQFGSLKSFVCIGEIFPNDRPQSISAKWEIRIVIADVNYVAREGIYVATQGADTYLVLGQYARSSWVYDAGKWTQHSKETTVKIKYPKSVKAYSESMNMRFNSLNLDGQVQ